MNDVDHLTEEKSEKGVKTYESIVHYGDSNEVTRVGYSDYNEFTKNDKRSQSMEGFDKDYRDIVDYILKITHRIWEEKGIGVIYDTYHNNVSMHTGSVTVQGINAVISGTLQTLHAFPDRNLIGENVIWSGNDKEGFLSSHRIASTATNLGDSSFGLATDKRVFFRTVVDCFVHSNRIVEEWLVRDNLSIVKQLGYDPVEVAKKLASESKTKSFQLGAGANETMDGQFSPKVYASDQEGFEIGDFTLQLYNSIYQRRLFNEVKHYYSETAVVHAICEQDLTGHQQIQSMLISLFASFPTSKVMVERVTCNDGQLENEWDVAVRWTLQGLHDGIGYFGQPSGAPVTIQGISHLKVRNEEVVEEWMTFDGLDVLRQIYLESEEG
ncbi:ester cyclase [Pseudalkalibacillus sp. NRS-1564]|uniref:ester cyclase n=1 Tax=Pseudalkalibacillus sp. NRS-1564 TaxID=3233900 RepID=UPI003D28C082